MVKKSHEYFSFNYIFFRQICSSTAAGRASSSKGNNIPPIRRISPKGIIPNHEAETLEDETETLEDEEEVRKLLHTNI